MLLTPMAAQAQTQDLFNAQGFRSTNYRAPVPESAPGARTVTLPELQSLIADGAVLLDVMGLQHFRITPDGHWLTPERRQTLPGAVWLPVVGWGTLEDWQSDYLQSSLAALTKGDKSKPIVVFCKLDCWLSWNTIKRLKDSGYQNLAWFPGGTEAWADAGHPLIALEPLPLR